MNKKDALIACLNGEKIRNVKFDLEFYWDGSRFCQPNGCNVNIHNLPWEGWEIVIEPIKEVIEIWVSKDWKPEKWQRDLKDFLIGREAVWESESNDIATQKLRITIEEIE
jgi:hypothetical protein